MRISAREACVNSHLRTRSDINTFSVGTQQNPFGFDFFKSIFLIVFLKLIKWDDLLITNTTGNLNN